MALSSRAHAFSVEALIGSHKKRKLRDWDGKGLDLSMESLSPDGQLPDADDPAQCLDLNPGERGARRDGRRRVAGPQEKLQLGELQDRLPGRLPFH